MDAQCFTRLRFACNRCGNSGVILSACVNPTCVILEGLCLNCRKSVSTTFDLIELDFRQQLAEPLTPHPAISGA